jgi:hypothetical protein
MKDAQQWVHETGTTIPVTATGLPEFTGDAYSDFRTWHMYTSYDVPGDKYTLNTECMNRQMQSVPGIVEHFKGKVGFILWEFGIGRDNCRFAWKDKPEHPATSESATPFHGLVYPDGHPWSVDDMKALMGEEAFAKIPVFKAEYFKDERFGELAKTSVTPFVDFDLPDEAGVGSPDASAGVPYQHYSVRYTATIAAPSSGRYTFSVDTGSQAGGGVARLTLDGKEAGQVNLTAGEPHTLVLEYAHATGPTHLRLTWSGPGTPETCIIPAAK